MKSYVLSIALLFLFSCSSEKPGRIFQASNLPSFFVKVDHTKDVIIKTPKGAAIRIRKGTFTHDEELEIKEAYTMKDILLGGLVTETNGHPLRSGGMIYINTKEGSEVTLLKPITVLLPRNYYEDGMELYKGEVSENGINWEHTDTLQSTADEQILKVGRELFVQNCSTCHAIKKNLTGPALAGVYDRGPWAMDRKNIFKWVHNPGAFIPTTAYTRTLQKEYGQIMPSFIQLSEYDVEAVMAFVKNEEQKPITDTFTRPLVKDSLYAMDESVYLPQNQPCGDTTFYDDRKLPMLSDAEIQEEFEDSLDSDNAGSNGLAEPALGLRKGFTDEHISDGAYRFEIKTLGWYNVDAQMKGLPNTRLCDLKIQVKGEAGKSALTVYAFFPNEKNLTLASKQKGNVYSFDKIEGKIPLYLGEKGVVLVFGNYRDQFYYTTAHFMVQTSQTLVVELQASTEEALLKAVQNEKLEGIDMDIIKQKMKITPCDSALRNASYQP
jgi:cytochrome c2